MGKELFSRNFRLSLAKRPEKPLVKTRPMSMMLIEVINHTNVHVTGPVFTRSFSGRLASDNQNSMKTVPFPSRLKLRESANFNRIFIKF